MEEEEDSDVEMEGMDMNDDEDVVEDVEEDANVEEDAERGEQEELKVDEHELEELEEARKERMDLMCVCIYCLFAVMFDVIYLILFYLNRTINRAKELASKQKDQKRSGTGTSKFDYLIGQSEVFAHFLAGELTVI